MKATSKIKKPIGSKSDVDPRRQGKASRKKPVRGVTGVDLKRQDEMTTTLDAIVRLLNWLP